MSFVFLNKTPWRAIGGIAIGGLGLFLAREWPSPNHAVEISRAGSSIDQATRSETWSRLIATPKEENSSPLSLVPGRAEPLSLEAVTDLAKTVPQHALNIALTEPNPSRQSELIAAALRGWARTDPRAAADWLKRHSDSASESAWAALFDGAVLQPERALRLAHELSRADPGQAREYGYALIFALNRAAEFCCAADYAAIDSSRWQSDLVIAAYHDWGRRFPEAALVSAIQLPDSTTRSLAVQSILSGWSREDPEGMADAAIHFPEGTEKESALTKAIRAWLIKDPEKARDWIMLHDRAIPAAEIALRDD